MSLRACNNELSQFEYALTDIQQNKRNTVNYLLSLELHSPVVISYNQRKVIFKENDFSDNIGWSGGAI